MNLKETANGIISNFRAEYNSKENYALKDVLYIAIDEHNNVVASIFDNMLENAHEAILVLVNNCKEITNWYNWFHIYHINPHGGVEKNYNSDSFCITTSTAGGFKNQYFDLEYKRKCIYSKRASRQNWSENFVQIWNVMKIAKACEANPAIKDVISKLD
ncbi:MAG: hypothetical protein HDS02_08475 [Bacteroides sp.]|nr:hypothetical protein [Bacteroides sp.]